MGSILLSIKPEYAEQIFKGSKRYEYRRRLPKESVSKIVVYATHPIMKVVGEIEVAEVITGSPTSIWERTKNEAGISRAKYRIYFRGCTVAYAYKLSNAVTYESPKELLDIGVQHPPQSFVYLEGSFFTAK